MNEEERVTKINTASGKILEDLLESMENETLDEDQFLSETYARLVAAKLMGFSPTKLVEDAEEAAQRLLDLVEESEVTDENSND
tara:strand:- start:199 stop:450 length:252 start_codon:yes stop_codon:yes gene_type:complete